MKSKKVKLICMICSVIMGAQLVMGCGYGDPKIMGNPMLNAPKGLIENGKVTVHEFLNEEENELFQNINGEIDVDNIYNIIDELASEKYLGRLTGSEGNILAAEYLRAEYEKAGLVPLEGKDSLLMPYSQKVFWLEEAPTIKILNDNDEVVDELLIRKDFSTVSRPIWNIDGKAKGEIVEIGSVEDLNKVKDDLKGKVILACNGMAWNEQLTEAISKEENTPAVIISNYGEVEKDLRKAVYMPQHEESENEDNKYMYAGCDEEAAKKIRKAIEEGNQLEYTLSYKTQTKDVHNVVGMIPGTDENLKDEYIIICGHFDHLGDNFDGRYNPGASDNASGTACVLEIANSFKKSGIQPKRPIIFAAFNGEENGLLGSRAFVQDLVKMGIDVEKIEMLNIDMIANKVDGPLYLGAMVKTQLVKDLKTIAVEMEMNIKLDMGKGYSDHSSLEAFGGEAISFVELEQSEYHRPEDTIDVIDKEDLADVVELVLRYLSSKI